MSKKETMCEKEILKNIEQYNAGKINIRELNEWQYSMQRDIFTPKLLELRNAGEWESFITMALTVYEVMPLAFTFYEEVPDSLKYSFAVDAYTHHGDAIPAVRKAVRGARKYGAPELPADLARQDEITVYRAGEEPIEKARYRISWTIDLNVALFFLRDYVGRHATHLYRAKIKPGDVIAYTDDRKEKEILQYGRVYGIEELEEHLQD